MSQIFVAQYLNKLLQFWEDINLGNELGFQIHLKTRNILTKDDQHLEPLTGSELNRLGIISRAIPDYQNLRKILMGQAINDSTFLPRIPKEMREIFKGDYDLFMDHEFVKGPANIPSFLKKWNETRKACILHDTLPLPLVDLRQENWLSNLPYHAFFLKIESPFVFEAFDPHEEWSMENFLIYDDNDHIKVMIWPREIDKFILTEEERKHVIDAIGCVKKDRMPSRKTEETTSQLAPKMSDWFLSEFTVKKGTSLIRIVQGTEPTVRYADIYNENHWTMAGQKISDLYGRLRVTIEAINGFCKLMATLPPKSSVEVMEHIQTKQLPILPRQWFELPMQTVDYFHTEKENDVIVIKRGTGSEKSPHVRRKHIRRIVRKDGSVDEIWIDQITIRADKLATEQLQGGAIKIQ